MTVVEQYSFETVLEIVRGIAAPAQNEERSVRWIAGKQLGVARDHTGAYELFLPGSELAPASLLVAHHLHFDEWQDSNETRFRANRLVLPNELHFVPVAAFLVEELLRNGLVADGLLPAFARSEPLIEMALRRVALSEQVLVGLIGELRLLALLLDVAPSPEVRGRTIEAWRGYERATYDFVFPDVVVEVKTTVGGTSQHEIQGVRQVDAPRGTDGQPLLQLHLLSVGLRHAAGPDDPRAAISLPDLVDEILRVLSSGEERNEIQVAFLSKLRRYGGENTRGYDHDSMAQWGVYRLLFVHHFFRIYDMNDPAVAVLRRSDVVDRFVLPESVNFSVQLPERITGDVNPRTDIRGWAHELLSASLSG
jgi:hypothetical protein